MCSSIARCGVVSTGGSTAAISAVVQCSSAVQQCLAVLLLRLLLRLQLCRWLCGVD